MVLELNSPISIPSHEIEVPKHTQTTYTIITVLDELNECISCLTFIILFMRLTLLK